MEAFWEYFFPVFGTVSLVCTGFTCCSAQTQTRIGLLEEIPRSGSDSLPLLLGHLGVCAHPMRPDANAGMKRIKCG